MRRKLRKTTNEPNEKNDIKMVELEDDGKKERESKKNLR